MTEMKTIRSMQYMGSMENIRRPLGTMGQIGTFDTQGPWRITMENIDHVRRYNGEKVIA
jgi:hypothetical protein